MSVTALKEAAKLQKQGRLEEAEAHCLRALRQRPFDAAPCHLLGTILHQRGRTREALELMRRSVGMDPSAVVLRVNLAALLGKSGKLKESLDQLLMAVKLGGGIPELHNNLGVTLEKLGRAHEAVPAYRTALALNADYPDARFNLGNAVRKLGDIGAALEEYRQVLRLRPQYAKAYNGLASAAADLGDADEAIGCYRKLVEMDPTNAGARSSLLYTIHYSPDYDPEALSREHREWGRLFCEPLKGQIRDHENDRTPDRRLRIGYVSPDFREHTVPHFVTAALQHHDRERFELFCYSDVEKPDGITRTLRGLVEHWHGTRGTSDIELEQLIRADRIDILVDLRGHAADNRLTLFARKPAPVQVNMVGYFDTTGLSTMDYRITDEHMDPPGQTEKYHTEQLIRMPHSCWCYTADEDAPEVMEPPALKNGFVTFGSLNKIVKVSRSCANLCASVLEAVPNSRLLLSVAEPAGAERRLEELGLPMDRVDLVGKTRMRREYLERFGQIDIALDTFPFNGITTTCDGLWMGVPCVSLVGGTTVSRGGRSILHAAHLPELATDTPEAFVRAAVGLASDPDRLRELRLGIRDRLLASALMDHQSFTRNLDASYRRMWRDWCG